MAIRYGVIGTGMTGVEHVEDLVRLEGATLTAIADPYEPARGWAVRAAGPDRPLAVFDDHRALLESGGCDAVVVATPSATHVDVLLDVLATPLHVLAEQPLCTSVADGRKVVEAAAAGPPGRVVWLGHAHRYVPSTRELVREVHAGTAGDVRMISVREHRYPFLAKAGHWNRFNRTTGGTLVEACSHTFDVMNLLAGARPVRVTASGGHDVNHLDEAYDGEVPDVLDNAFVIVEYERGVRAMLDLCMFAEASRNDEEICVVGDAGKVEALVTERIVRIGRRADGLHAVSEREVGTTATGHEGLRHGGSYLEHVDLLRAILDGAPPAAPLEDGLWSVAVGEAAQRSIDEHRPVELAEVVS